MPGVGQNPYSTGAQVLTLLQSLVSDPQGQLFTASFCLQAINSGARYVARELRNRGKMTLVEDNYEVTIPAVLVQDATQQVSLAYAGISGDVASADAPALPASLVEPLVLWERPTGTTNRLTEMKNKTNHGGLAKVPQGNFLGEWEWRGDAIVFRGSLAETDVIIRGTISPGIFAIGTGGALSGSLTDVDALDVVAYIAAAQLLPQRGAQVLAQQYETKAETLVEQLATSTTRQEQFSPVQMRPFHGGRRGRSRYSGV